MTSKRVTYYECDKCGVESEVEDTLNSPADWKYHGMTKGGASYLCPACQALFEAWLKVPPHALMVLPEDVVPGPEGTNDSSILAWGTALEAGLAGETVTVAVSPLGKQPPQPQE